MHKSYLIAATLAFAVTGWMAVGYFVNDSNGKVPSGDPSTAEERQRMLVEVRAQKATRVARHIVAQGQVEPNRTVTVRAEAAGRIAEVVAQEGRPIEAKDTLVRIEMNDRAARLKQAEARLREQRRAYDGAKRLGQRGYQAQRQIDEIFSALQAARAELAAIRLEIRNTRIRAPFSGILETRRVEIGDYVDVNGEIVTVVDNDPLMVTVQIAQQDIDRIARGDRAEVTFATGQHGQGVVRYIAPRAEESTRTFRVEIEVPNTDSRIRSGISAEARIPTGEVAAHFLSPAVLTLNAAGVVGIKTVNEADVVEFHPISIVFAEASGVWVSGLPEAARIITVGQGFVRNGEAVRVAPASAAISEGEQRQAAAESLQPSPDMIAGRR